MSEFCVTTKSVVLQGRGYITQVLVLSYAYGMCVYKYELCMAYIGVHVNQ